MLGKCVPSVFRDSSCSKLDSKLDFCHSVILPSLALAFTGAEKENLQDNLVYFGSLIHKVRESLCAGVSEVDFLCVLVRHKTK